MDAYPHGDRRLPHHAYPPRRLAVDELHKLTGVICWKVDLRNAAQRIGAVRRAYSLVPADEVCIDGKRLRDQEHLLSDMFKPLTRNVDVVHLIVDGNIYFDVCVSSKRLTKVANVTMSIATFVQRASTRTFVETRRLSFTRRRPKAAKNANGFACFSSAAISSSFREVARIAASLQAR